MAINTVSPLGARSQEVESKRLQRRPHTTLRLQHTPAVMFDTNLSSTKSSRARIMARHTYNDEDWCVTPCVNATNRVKVSHRIENDLMNIILPKNRLNTFKQKCDVRKIRRQLASVSSCTPTCKLHCINEFNLGIALSLSLSLSLSLALALCRSRYPSIARSRSLSIYRSLSLSIYMCTCVSMHMLITLY